MQWQMRSSSSTKDSVCGCSDAKSAIISALVHLYTDCRCKPSSYTYRGDSRCRARPQQYITDPHVTHLLLLQLQVLTRGQSVQCTLTLSIKQLLSLPRSYTVSISVVHR